MSAGLGRSRHRWQPQQSQVHHGSDGPGYLDRTPTCTGPLSGPFIVRIEAWQRWGGVGQSFQEDLVRSKSRMFCDRNETMMMQNARTVRRSVDANEQARERAKTTPLWNEAPLNCVSLRSELDCEVTCGAVKGQDERPFRAPLTAPQVTPEVYAARKKTSKVSREDRQNGGCCGSTELPVVAPERS